MLILAFDTSNLAGSVALLDAARVLGERQLDPARRSAQTLAPAIADLLAEQGIAGDKIQLVATTVGPGSFTGLRIGVTTAKTIAYAAGAEVIGLSTLEVIAHQHGWPPIPPVGASIETVLDAHRRELFVGRFQVTPEPCAADWPYSLARKTEDEIVPAQRWLEMLPAGTFVSGRGLEKLADRLPAGVVVAQRSAWEPAARTIGRLACREYEAGRRDDLWKLAPLYLRPSYADEKAAQRQR